MCDICYKDSNVRTCKECREKVRKSNDTLDYYRLISKPKKCVSCDKDSLPRVPRCLECRTSHLKEVKNRWENLKVIN